MKVFDKWYKENFMNDKNISLQFTKLTPDDITTHEDIYIDVLVDLAPVPSGIYGSIYYEYAIEEVQKANDLFQKTFGN